MTGKNLDKFNIASVAPFPKSELKATGEIRDNLLNQDAQLHEAEDDGSDTDDPAELCGKNDPYWLTEIDHFDARQGYKRCDPPAVGILDVWQATADLWRDPIGHLVMRFSSQGYIFSFQAFLPSGEKIPDFAMNDFVNYLMDVLLLWIVEGVDDIPTTSDVLSRLGKPTPHV